MTMYSQIFKNYIKYRFDVGDTVIVTSTLGDNSRVFITGHTQGRYDIALKLSKKGMWQVAERYVVGCRMVLTEKNCNLKIIFRGQYGC